MADDEVDDAMTLEDLAGITDGAADLPRERLERLALRKTVDDALATYLRAHEVVPDILPGPIEALVELVRELAPLAFAEDPRAAMGAVDRLQWTVMPYLAAAEAALED